MTSSQHADTLPDWVLSNIMADGVADPNTARAMGLVPVNARKVTSVVGHSLEIDSEFVVTRIVSDGQNRNRPRNTSDDRTQGHLHGKTSDD